MPQHSVNATLILRNDTSTNWTTVNPVLAKGEIGAEINTGLLKLGDGVTHYNDLAYINDNALIDSRLITRVDGQLTVANYGHSYWIYDTENAREREIIEHDLTLWPSTLQLEVKNNTARWVLPNVNIDLMRGTIDGALVTLGRLNPQYQNEATSKHYVDTQIDSKIAAANHLRRLVVTELPSSSNANINTIYMIKDPNATGSDKYKEYTLIDGELVQIGDTSVDLTNYIQKISNPIEGHLVAVAADGSLVDTGVTAQGLNALEVATSERLGGVRASNITNYVNVTDRGYMYLNAITTDIITNGTEDFVLNGGNAYKG